MGLRMQEQMPPKEYWGSIAIIAACLLVASVLTISFFRKHPFSVELGDDVQFHTLWGTVIVPVHEVEFAELGFDVQPSGSFRPLAKPKPAYPVMEWKLKSGRIFYCYIRPDEIEVVSEFLRSQPKLDREKKIQLSNPQDCVRQYLQCVTEDYLVEVGRFFAIPAGDTFEEHQVASEGYALMLKDLIDEHWFVDLSEISDSPDAASPYRLIQDSSDPPQGQSLQVMEQVSLGKDDRSGIWRFSQRTVQFLKSQTPVEEDFR